MNKRKLHHQLGRLRHIHYSLLLIFALGFSVLAVLTLRDNNRQMIILRNEVFAADKNSGDIEGALSKLRKYVYAHMNTNLSSGQNSVKPPIQLKYTYERLTSKAQAEYEAATTKVLADAEATCLQQFPGKDININRLNCAKDYATAHPVTQQQIPGELYKFDFASPFWSPDLAGFSLLAAGFFFLLFVLRFLSEFFIKRELAE